MGYPMSYDRVINRNYLNGNYDDKRPLNNSVVTQPDMIRGDLRRLEEDQRDELHLACYAEACNVTTEQAKSILDAFFAGNAHSFERAPKTLKRHEEQKKDQLLMERWNEIIKLQARVRELEKGQERTCLTLCDKHKGSSWSGTMQASFIPNPTKIVCPVCTPPEIK